MIRRFTRNGRDAALAATIVRALEPRFEAIDSRFEAIDNRFEAVDRRFEQMDLRFEAIDNRFGAMDVKWERRFVALADEMSRLRAGDVDVREHVARLHENVNARMDAFNARMDAFNARMDGFEARLNEMGEEFAAQFAALSETVVHGFSRPEPA